ncbi:MAG: hypothetical protein E5Y52_01840 [Mesorhizobium sp.]|nr:MAG: hypothetical protein E5Y52_01840 [Mesorhizobium sp.]
MSFHFKLPEITYPLTMETIGKTLAVGEDISVHCHTYLCGHTGQLTLLRIGRVCCHSGNIEPKPRRMSKAVATPCSSGRQRY